MRRERRRRGRRGRMPTPVFIGKQPPAEAFDPQPSSEKPPVLLEPAEVEAFRLVDVEGLSQEEAGERMGVSRGTVWRLLQEARRKTAQALTEGRRIQISSGQP
ncbi:MAG: DUF134 domain-containing protein [Candidatus Bathyarchaeota archaeon]|nr:DUF134 domain-containing protein [Candidatus Bathyarchaeota archaeon]